jgi:hypothetical protein
MKPRTFSTIVIATLIISILPIAGYADYYSNRNCANNGNGSSWSCAAGAGQPGAFNDIPNAGVGGSCSPGYTWTLGSTYWLAGSDTAYSSSCIRQTTGSGRLTIKKASAASHGTETGWDASYGTKQAVIGGGIGIHISGVTIDGSYRVSAESGHGFKFAAAGSTNLIYTANNYLTTGAIIKYAELTHTSYDTSSASAIYMHGNGTNTYQYLYIHDISGIGIHNSGGFENSVFEESVLGRIGRTTSSDHTELIKSEGVTKNVTIRNNLFYDWKSTGGIILDAGFDNWMIYNNVFTQRTAGLDCGNGAISAQQSNTAGDITNIKVYNNTFANISSLKAYIFAAGLGNMSGQGNDVKNNLFYNVATNPATCGGGCTKGHNWYSSVTGYTPSGTEIAGSGDPFISSRTENFRLTGSVGPSNLGLNLSSYFTTDKDGNNRPVGNLGWSIGAYEYNAFLYPPTNLKIRSTFK